MMERILHPQKTQEPRGSLVFASIRDNYNFCIQDAGGVQDLFAFLLKLSCVIILDMGKLFQRVRDRYELLVTLTLLKHLYQP